MREIRPSGSEGGGPQPNAASLPLSKLAESRKSMHGVGQVYGLGWLRSPPRRLKKDKKIKKTSGRVSTPPLLRD